MCLRKYTVEENCRKCVNDIILCLQQCGSRRLESVTRVFLITIVIIIIIIMCRSSSFKFHNWLFASVKFANCRCYF